MRRFALAALLASSLPLVADAVTMQDLLNQVTALQNQIATAETQQDTCDVPTHSMSRGATGDDVTRLQQFLARDAAVYPEANVTGYYGVKTVAAVQRFQIKNDIVSSGTPATSGFGAVGRRTLAAIHAQACTQVQTPPSKPKPVQTQTVTTNVTTTTVTTAATTTQSVTPTKSFSISFSSPATSTSVRLGGTATISWKSVDAPLNSHVTLSLEKTTGQAVGEIKSALPASGTYYWTIPAASRVSSSYCSSDPFSCISEIANANSGCTGPLCALSFGTYRISAQLVQSYSVLARAKSPPFTIGTTTSVDATTDTDTSTSNVTSAWLYTYSTTTDFTDTSNNNTAASMCMYSGVPYSEGISLLINCADVTAAGQSCGSYGGMQMTCKAGQWIDGNGVAQTVRNVTTSATGPGSCTTPWHSQSVANGNQIPYQPFFTNGVSGTSATVPLMKCLNGNWQKCSWIGDNCVAYTVF